MSSRVMLTTGQEVKVYRASDIQYIKEIPHGADMILKSDFDLQLKETEFWKGQATMCMEQLYGLESTKIRIAKIDNTRKKNKENKT